MFKPGRTSLSEAFYLSVHWQGLLCLQQWASLVLSGRHPPDTGMPALSEY